MSTPGRKFELEECLGRGSFGEVYAATMNSAGGLRTPVAVKLLRADIDLAGQAVRRLADEGRLLARLNHPAILRVYDLIRLEGRLALVTELIDGSDLSTLIRTGEPMPTRPLLQALSHVSSGLAAALETVGPEGPLRLVHRDVKPSNIRIDRHGQAKLLDFGVARFDASDREVRTASDLIVGSIPYMAPERFIQRAVHPSSDVFSLACTLYEGLAGQRFYGRAKTAQITALALKSARYQTHLTERLASLQTGGPLKHLLSEMLRNDASQRPDAAAVARRLEEIAEEIEGPTLRMWCRDRSWPEPPALTGSLHHQTLIEGPLLEGEQKASPSGGPQLQLRGHATLQPTVEPSALGAVPSHSGTLVPPAAPADPVETVERPAPITPTFGLAESLPSSQRPTVHLAPQSPESRAKTVRLADPPTPSGDRWWVVSFAIIGTSLAAGLAIFFGFVVFTALMTSV